MSDKTSRHDLAASRKFIPDVKPLESRLLLSQFQRVRFPDGTSVAFPTFNHLPRTGGVGVRTGTLVGIGVAQPTTNTVHVSDEGQEDFTGEWNGRPTRSFTGVTATVVQAESATNDRITFNLKGPRISPAAAAGGSFVPTDADPATEAGHSLQLSRLRTSGFAVQTGSLLTATVDNPTLNTVEISNYGAGVVRVEWNGGHVHSFKGVETIVVDTHNARNDLVAIDNARIG
jgi:hypothetical protein